MTAEPHHPDDEKLLRQLGYEQELSRRMSGFSNFAIMFLEDGRSMRLPTR